MEENINEQRLGSIEESQTKITDIFQECLEHVFTYLDLADLISVADANMFLRKATYLPFNQKFGGKTIEIDFPFKNYTKIPHKMYRIEESKIIIIISLEMSLQILRCFGHLITQLKLYAGQFSSDNNDILLFTRIFIYINDYCTESLRKISITPAHTISRFKTIFLNVEEIETDETQCSTYKLHENEISTVFPKLRRFHTLFGEGITLATERIPNLEHLGICHSCPIKNQSCTPIVNLNTFLAIQNNPQLRSISLKTNNLEFVRSAEQYLQSIENFEIFIYSMHSYKGEDIYLKNVTKFKLIQVSTEPLHRIPFSFHQLRDCTLAYNWKNSNAFSVFIEKNPSIEKLTLKISCMYSLINELDDLKALPLLKEIVLLNPIRKSIDISHLIDYLTKFKSVIRCSFYYRNSKEIIRKYCGIEWNPQFTVDIGGMFVTLERVEQM